MFFELNYHFNGWCMMSFLYDVFSVNLLEPYRKTKNPLCTIVPAEPEGMNDKENWLIKERIDSERVGRKKKVEYRILGEGFRMEEGQWEP